MSNKAAQDGKIKKGKAAVREQVGGRTPPAVRHERVKTADDPPEDVGEGQVVPEASFPAMGDGGEPPLESQQDRRKEEEIRVKFGVRPQLVVGENRKEVREMQEEQGAEKASA